MPTYQYACTECGHQLEAVQSFTDAALVECPECAGRLRKLYSAVGIVFKGSGFYRTDSRSGAVAADAGKDNGAKDGSKDAGSKDAASKDGGSKESASKDGGAKDSAKKDSGSKDSGGASPAKSESSTSSTSTKTAAPAGKAS